MGVVLQLLLQLSYLQEKGEDGGRTKMRQHNRNMMIIEDTKINWTPSLALVAH